MNIFTLSFKNILARPLSSLLSWLLLSFGICIVVMILQVSDLLKLQVTNNTAGIDLVVGAKGSPLQIILANIFHVDFPTGNISLKSAYGLSNNRNVRQSIPLSLGDSYMGYHIVGTTRSYGELYQAGLASGNWVSSSDGAVIGSQVAQELALNIGDQFASQHGMEEGGEGHDHHFTVTGILQSTGRVVDQLILVNLESIWLVHGHEPNHTMDSLVDLEKWGVAISSGQYESEEITALLVQYRSPMGAVLLPQIVNKMDNLQAASPAYEASRLFNILGIGIKVLNILGMLIIGISAVSVFISLFNSLKERRYEMAILRTMGATRGKVFLMVLLEGLLVTLSGIITGLVIGHTIVQLIMSQLIGSHVSMIISFQEWIILVASIVIGILASTIPALMAYKTDISKTLSEA